MLNIFTTLRCLVRFASSTRLAEFVLTTTSLNMHLLFFITLFTLKTYNHKDIIDYMNQHLSLGFAIQLILLFSYSIHLCQSQLQKIFLYYIAKMIRNAQS